MNEVPTRETSQTIKSLSPTSNPLRFFPKLLLMLRQILSSSAILMPNLRRVYLIEDRPHLVPHRLLALQNLCKLVQAPAGRCVILRVDHDRDPRLLDCIDELRGDGFALRQLVVHESVDSLTVQSVVEEASEALARVFTSEAEEDVETPSWSES